MKTSDNNFELITQEVLKQKQLLEDLQLENDELNRQLGELREGRDIFVDILDKRFPLVGEPVSVSPGAVATANADLSLQETTEILSEALPSSAPEAPIPAVEPSVEERQEDLPTYVTPTMSSYWRKPYAMNFRQRLPRKWRK